MSDTSKQAPRYGDTLGGGPFPTTCWSEVERAAKRGAPSNPDLSELLRRYLSPLKGYLIHQMHLASGDADNLLQEFILNKVLEKNLLAQANQERGRFRSFLLASLNHFYIDEIRRGKAKERSPGQIVSLKESFTICDDAPSGSEILDVAWATQVLEQTIAQMREECKQSKRIDIWRVFEGRLLEPILNNAKPMPYSVLVKEIGFVSPSQAANALVTANRMFARILRRLIGQYESEDAAIDAEIADLRSILARSGR